MPYISEEELKKITDKISVLEKWKESTEKKLSFLNGVTIEGRGKITLIGGHLKINSNVDTITLSKS
jgi:hypothetical protein